jgi:fluoride exporter
MNPPAWAGYLLVAVGGAVGAPLRYLIDSLIDPPIDTAVRVETNPRMPWGILTVNTVGSAALGLLAGLALGTGSAPWLLLGVGLCGALTTWSALSWDTAQLIRRRAPALAAANVVASVIAGLAAVTAGLLIGAALG